MPRGTARGGGGSNTRSNRPRAGTTRIAGVELQIDYDIDPATPAVNPGELFPERNLQEILETIAPLSKVEKAQIEAYTSLRKQIHEGPFFTVLDAGVRARKEAVRGSSTLVIADPFENGVETYSMRYAKGKRKAPALNEQECVLKYFPKELWGVLDSRYANSGVGTARKKVKVDLEKTKAKLDALPDEGDERIMDDEGVDSDEEPPDAAPLDDEFEEDEDDMAGDYNAEQYFDDGGDDAGDDYDGGDGGGDDGMY